MKPAAESISACLCIVSSFISGVSSVLDGVFRSKGTSLYTVLVKVCKNNHMKCVLVLVKVSVTHIILQLLITLDWLIICFVQNPEKGGGYSLDWSPVYRRAHSLNDSPPVWPSRMRGLDNVWRNDGKCSKWHNSIMFVGFFAFYMKPNSPEVVSKYIYSGFMIFHFNVSFTPPRVRGKEFTPTASN